jgi:hypothetical protein
MAGEPQVVLADRRVEGVGFEVELRHPEPLIVLLGQAAGGIVEVADRAGVVPRTHSEFGAQQAGTDIGGIERERRAQIVHRQHGAAIGDIGERALADVACFLGRERDGVAEGVDRARQVVLCLEHRATLAIALCRRRRGGVDTADRGDLAGRIDVRFRVEQPAARIGEIDAVLRVRHVQPVRDEPVGAE